MNNIKHILSIGGHPLDAELMGGPLSLFLQRTGTKSSFMHVTTGRLEKSDSTKEEQIEYLENLNTQIKKVAKGLNGEAIQLNYISSNMPFLDEFIEYLKQFIKHNEVDLVVTHNSGTLHDRHYYTYDGVTKAVLQLQKEGYKIDLLYGENLEDLVHFSPTLYVELNDDEVKRWFEALENYDVFKGKVNSVPYLDYYTTMGRVRGLESGSSKFIKAYMHGPKFLR